MEGAPETFSYGDVHLPGHVQLPANGQPGQLCLLLNGHQRPWTDFRSLMARVSAHLPGCVLVAIDQRGTGGASGTTEGLTIRTAAQDAAEVLRQLALRFPACPQSVLGVSMGGMVAQTLPSLGVTLSKLILVSTTPGLTSSQVTPWPRTEEAVRDKLRTYVGTKFLQSSPLIFTHLAKNIAQTLERAGSAAASADQSAAAAQFSAPDLPQALGPQTLIILGDEDRVFPLEEARGFEKTLPGSRLVVYPGAGHLLLLEEPGRLAEDIAQWLAGPVLS